MLNFCVKGLRITGINLVIFLLLVIGAVSALAQQPVLEFSTLEALKSIENSKTTSVVQDSTGYIWIGTEEGLLRFDGQNLFTYRHNETDSTSIPSDIINKLFVDSDSNLWVCTNEGLCRYNPEYDNFSQIVVQSNLGDIPTTYITAISEDLDGHIYIGSGTAVFKYDKLKNRFNKVTSLTSGHINSIVFDELNNLWIGASTNGGLFYFDRETDQIDQFENGLISENMLPNNEIQSLRLVKNTLWIATNGSGIYSYNVQDKALKHYTFPVNLENYALSIFADRKMNIWICTYGGLKLYNPKNDNFYDYFYQANNPETIGGSLWDFYEDSHGNYWTVYSQGGIKIAKYINRFSHIDSRPDKFWHTSEKNTTSVFVDKTGNLWIGFYLNGIDILKWKERKTERYLYKNNTPGGLGDGSIFAIFGDSKQQIWIGSYLGGLRKFKPSTKSFEAYTHQPNDTLTIADNDVRSISEDQNGNLWLAVQGKGVDCFDPLTKKFRHFNTKNNRLSNDYTFQVLNDSRGNLWVATSWGLNLLKNGERIFKNFYFDKNDSTTISSNTIYSIHEDEQKNIWIGTAEGLNLFEPKTQSFVRYSAGLKNKHVGGILSDRKNDIWISTNAGISKFDQETNQFTNFDQGNGLLSKDFSDRACFKDDKNNLFFGGSDGVDFFNPDHLNYEKKQPPIVLTDFRILNKSVSSKTDNSILKKHISHTSEIVLDYDNNTISFLYQAISPINTSEITYAFRLDGFDKDWVYAKTKREANYANLEPGKYRFKVRAKVGNGDWSKSVTSVRLIIKPAWWMTIWFKTLASVLFLTIIIGIFYLRIKQLKAQREKLEKLVAERTIEIQSKNDQLRALNASKDKLFSIVSHDLRSPFNAILGFQDILINNYYDFTDLERLEMINQVHSTTNQVFYLVENLLGWARLQSNNIQFRPIKFDLNEVILEKISLYQKIAGAKGITLSYELPDKALAYGDINLFETTLRNLLSNAIKFTPLGGTINVKVVNPENNFLKIKVTDSGTGMTAEQIKDLFHPENIQIKSGTNGEHGSGLGLLLCKEFTEKNYGTLTVESEPGKGSEFIFTIPAYNHK